MLRRAAPLLLATVMLLTGCGAGGQAPEAIASRPAAEQTATPTPTPTPTSAGTVTVGLESLTVTRDGQSAEYAFSAPEPLLALIEELTGQPRSGEDIEDPWGNGDVVGTTYMWEDIRVSVWEGGPASVSVLSETLGSAPVHTAGGIAVGASRADVLAAQGWEVWDENGDGIADYFGIEAQPAEGTESLSRPGEVGREYILVAVDGDIVTQLQTPSNDFSDL